MVQFDHPEHRKMIQEIADDLTQGRCPGCKSGAPTAPLGGCTSAWHGQWAHEPWIDPWPTVEQVNRGTAYAATLTMRAILFFVVTMLSFMAGNGVRGGNDWWYLLAVPAVITGVMWMFSPPRGDH